MPKGHSLLESDVKKLTAALLAAIARIEALELRRQEMDEAFAKGYLPTQGRPIGGARG